jgi:hypothetical protein
MRHSENEKRAFKRKRKKKGQLLRKKGNTIIVAKKDISSGNAGRLKLIMRKPTILKRNGNERFRKSLN